MIGTSLALSPDGRRLATTREDQKTVQILDADNLEEVLTLGGNTAYITRLVFSLDGKLMASGSEDGVIRIWDVASGQSVSIIRGHTGAVEQISFHPDGRRMASCSRNSVKVWDVRAGREAFLHEGGAWRDVTFSPDGHLLTACGDDFGMRIWDATPVGH
jgi:WD40 repeat protein